MSQVTKSWLDVHSNDIKDGNMPSCRECGAALKEGDTVLICCDGLWDYFPEDELHKMVSRSKDFDKTTKKLIDLANERGGKDNITVIIFQLVSIEFS